jgi:LPS sulfotransferase NodH
MLHIFLVKWFIRAFERQIVKTRIKKEPCMVLLATQRSGSTLVCDFVYSLGLGKPDEHILDMIDGKDLEAFEAGLLTVGDKEWFSILRYKKLISNGGVNATKIMINHIGNTVRFLCGSRSVSENAIFSAFADFFSGSLFLFIRREDKLAQAVSRFMASHSGVCHVGTVSHAYLNVCLDGLEKHAAVIFSYQGIKKNLDNVKSESEAMARLYLLLKERGQNCVEVVYEDFLESKYNLPHLNISLSAFVGENKLISRGNLEKYEPGLNKCLTEYGSLMMEAYCAIDGLVSSNGCSDDDVLQLTVDYFRSYRFEGNDWAALQADFIERNRYL